MRRWCVTCGSVQLCTVNCSVVPHQQACGAHAPMHAQWLHTVAAHNGCGGVLPTEYCLPSTTQLQPTTDYSIPHSVCRVYYSTVRNARYGTILRISLFPRSKYQPHNRPKSHIPHPILYRYRCQCQYTVSHEPSCRPDPHLRMDYRL